MSSSLFIVIKKNKQSLEIKTKKKKKIIGFGPSEDQLTLLKFVPSQKVSTVHFSPVQEPEKLRRRLDFE
jgi:hypothetical protein